MIRLLFVILLCILASSQASAQNDASQMLLALSEDERNAAFTHLLRERNERCDRVIRTLFSGTALGLDDWEVLCRDRNSYSLSISPEVNADVQLVARFDQFDFAFVASDWRGRQSWLRRRFW